MATLRKVSMVVLGSLGMVLAVGCAAERHDDIPRSARLVAQDQGDVDFVAPDDGMVYVYDRGAGNMLYSGRIREGERVRVEPRDDRITLNGQTVMDKQIRDNNEVRIFYRAEPRADVAGSRAIIVPVQPAQPARSGDSEIIVQPRGQGDADTVRVRPGANGDAKVTVEPGEEGSKVTIEQDRR